MRVKDQDWHRERDRLRGILQEKLRDPKACQDLVTGYDDLLRSIWLFNTALLGSVGASAIMSQAIDNAISEAPLLQKLRISEKGVDLSQFQAFIAKNGCTAPEAMDAIIRLGAAVFRLLAHFSARATGKAQSQPPH